MRQSQDVEARGRTCHRRDRPIDLHHPYGESDCPACRTLTRDAFQGGITDRIIPATAEEYGLIVVTGDRHFKDRPGVRFLARDV